jgi:signal transduction histidine kinase
MEGSEAEQRDGLERLVTEALDERRLRRLIEVCWAIVSHLDLEVVLRRMLDVARELTGARYAALGILDERRGELERFLTVGIGEQDRAVIGELPRGRGVLGELIRDATPLRLSDVGEHPRSYGFPPGHPPMRTFLGVPIRIRGQIFGNLYLTEKEGGDFDEADEQAVVILADCAAIAIDNARLYKSVWDRRAELERAVRGLRATSEIAHALGGETELERVLELIVKRGRALVEARSVMILLEDQGDLVVAATAGEDAAATRGRRLPIEDSVFARMLQSRKAERVADVSSALRFAPGELGVGAQSALIVPLTFRNDWIGALLALDRLAGGPQFDAEDEELMRSFAAIAAAAVQTAKSVAEERLRESMEASEQERRRWARELHDDTLQGLGALRVVLSSALRRGSPEGLADAVRDAVDQIGAQISSLRNLITELRPAALDEIGLEPAIESLAGRTAASEGIAVETELQLGDGERMAGELENAIYRLVQEALTNIGKHAGATRVRLRVAEANGTIEVLVQDDGAGFDTGAGLSGFGLRGMRERVALVGGRLVITSTPGAGTTVRAVIPSVRASRRAATA